MSEKEYRKESEKKLDESKVQNAPALWSLSLWQQHLESSGCINFKNSFPNAQSDLLDILTPSPTSGHEPGAALAQS